MCEISFNKSQYGFNLLGEKLIQGFMLIYTSKADTFGGVYFYCEEVTRQGLFLGLEDS